MGFEETSLGGSGRSFPATSIGLLDRVVDAPFPDLEALCRRYWKPIYAYLRQAWARGNDDAKDLTQAFFLHLLEDRSLEGYERARGAFRTYLKVLLDSFAGHRRTALARLKRGGGAHVLSLDGAIDPPVDRASETPGRAFDRAWTAELVGHAVEQLRRHAAESDDALSFRILEAHDLADDEVRPSIREIAARLAVPKSEVERRLTEAREELRNALRRELARTTSDELALEREWHELLQF